MSTLGDVGLFILSIDEGCQLWDVNCEFGRDFQTQVMGLGKAICEEHGIEIGQAVNPVDPLKEKSQALFEELKQWVREREMDTQ